MLTVPFSIELPTLLLTCSILPPLLALVAHTPLRRTLPLTQLVHTYIYTQPLHFTVQQQQYSNDALHFAAVRTKQEDGAVQPEALACSLHSPHSDSADNSDGAHTVRSPCLLHCQPYNTVNKHSNGAAISCASATTTQPQPQSQSQSLNSVHIILLLVPSLLFLHQHYIAPLSSATLLCCIIPLYLSIFFHANTVQSGNGLCLIETAAVVRCINLLCACSLAFDSYALSVYFRRDNNRMLCSIC